MRWPWLPFLALLMIASQAAADPGDGNRLTYLDGSDPYYVGREFPKLITPQWVGEEGVEAVVVLAIDDMRGPDKWEAYLRPILERLKQIDGRAPVSIMTCQIEPEHPHLQTWLKEGLSLEIHTYDHPCPILKDGDLAKAKGTYDRCIDLLNQVPGNKPVAFRVPCCDSMNTPSPRFYAEIFNGTTPAGNFLQADSSVFNILTSADPELPRELVLDEEGRERFLKYVPRDRDFVNTIENYPYPYVIGRMCWQFPCAVPSDWEAQHLQKPNNPKTVEDLKAAIDCVVAKQGVFNLVFHPHGWIRNEQVIELIDHAQQKHGRKVKFLTFREAIERLNKNFLAGQPLRDKQGQWNGVLVLDLNHDGYQDAVISNDQLRATRLWGRASKKMLSTDFPVPLVKRTGKGERREIHARFGVRSRDGAASLFVQDGDLQGLWQFVEPFWQQVAERASLVRSRLLDESYVKADWQFMRLVDFDGDGICELLVGNGDENEIYGVEEERLFTQGPAVPVWKKLNLSLPAGTQIVDSRGRDAGLRFVDLDEDGSLDVIFSNHERYAIHLFESLAKGWSREVLAGRRGEKDPLQELPMIARADGTNNGFWRHSGHLWWQNEDTARMKNVVDRRSIEELLADVQPGPKSPEASLRSMHVRPGMRIELVAAEPLVMDPIAIAWGAEGKLWVVEMADYPLGIDGQGKHGGRLRYLEDSDGDGRYDRSTLFLDGLGYPTGIAPWRKGVLVSCAPEIFYAEDTDGDGKADLRQTLYKGFGEGNQQHRVNGFTYGLDNWFYAANGDSGGRIKSLKTGEEFNIGGRDFRIRPAGGQIDAQSGQAQFGRHRDDWGNWFGSNNSNPMWHYVLADHYLRRNPHLPAPDGRVMVSQSPGAAPVFPRSRTLTRFNDFNKANRFTSACSAIIYRDELLGEEFLGNSFVCEPVHNLVHREIVTPSGSTFTSRRAADEQSSEFLASSDNWFRPTMVQTGPDGALWVVDMYRHVIEHPQWIPADWQRRLDLRAGADRGRIYRVYHQDRPPRKIPRLDRLSPTGLVAALDSPNGWQRDMAQQLLIERVRERDNERGSQSESELERSTLNALKRLASEGKRPLARLHALCTLDGLASLEDKTLDETILDETTLHRALGDKHAGVRRHAVRLSEARLSASPRLASAVARLAADDDPQLRLQVAYSLGAWEHAEAAEPLGRLLLTHGGDRFLAAAAMSSVRQPHLEPLLALALEAPDERRHREMLKSLLVLATDLEQQSTVEQALDVVARPINGRYAEWQLDCAAGFLQGTGRRTVINNGMKRPATLRDRLIPRLSAMFDYCRQAAGNPRASEPERMLAVSLLGRDQDRRREDIEALAKLLGPQTSSGLQVRVVDTLGKLDDASVSEVLLEGWRGHSPELRSRILEVLTARPTWQRSLLDALEQKRLNVAELDAARRQQLLQRIKGPLKERAESLLSAKAPSTRQQVVEEYQAALALTGDRQRGAAVFEKSCAACHRLGDVGHAIGPDLTALTDRSPRSLLAAILDPNRAVEAKFVSYTAVTTDGRTLTGMLTGETGNSVTLVGQENKQQLILRSDIEVLESSGKSLMPEGVEKDLTPQAVADLFTFLAMHGPPRKTFAGNQPEVVKPYFDGSIRLFATQCEIYGNTLVLEEKYRNLGSWQSENDHAIWEFEVERPGRYSITLDYACADEQAGNRVLVEVAGNPLAAEVEGTGSWDNYRRLKLGDVELSAGRQRLLMRSQGTIRGALIDLRDIRLARQEGAQ